MKKIRCICRDCAFVQSVSKLDFFKAHKPQCIRCGSNVDELTRNTRVSDYGIEKIIRVDSKISRFELRATLYAKLRLLGLRVRADVPSTIDSNVFDIVVYTGKGKIKELIEVVASQGEMKQRKRKLCKYEQKITYLIGTKMVKNYIDRKEKEYASISDSKITETL